MVKTMSDKKQLAVVLGSTGNMAFAVANVVIALKKHFKPDFDLIIYCDNAFSESDRNLISAIIPANFIEYKYFVGEKEKFDSTTINRFTTLAFSRYECFRLLDKYKKTVWLDIDLLIRNDISHLINIDDNDIALYYRLGVLKNEFLIPLEIEGCNLDVKSFNSGVIVFSDSIKNNHDLADWCYKKTVEYAPHLKCPDQAIINLLIQVFNLKTKQLDVNFNCHPAYPESKYAAVLHPYSLEKFWNFYNYKEWNENYKQWLKMGGSPYLGKKFNFLEKILIYIKETFFPEAPDPFRHPKKFVKWIISSQRG